MHFFQIVVRNCSKCIVVFFICRQSATFWPHVTMQNANRQSGSNRTENIPLHSLRYARSIVNKLIQLWPVLETENLDVLVVMGEDTLDSEIIDSTYRVYIWEGLESLSWWSRSL